MEPLSYMRCVVDRNVVMRRIPVIEFRHAFWPPVKCYAFCKPLGRQTDNRDYIVNALFLGLYNNVRPPVEPLHFTFHSYELYLANTSS